MSQVTVYKCNTDGKEIGRKKHITLMLNRGTGTGIAVPHKNGGWGTYPVPDNFVHFHGTACMARYFADLMEKASKDK